MFATASTAPAPSRKLVAKNDRGSRAPVPSTTEYNAQAQAQVERNGRVVAASREHFRMGPLPPADELAKYAEVDPQFARDIVTHMQREQEHRHALDNKDQAVAHANETKCVDEMCRASKHGQYLFAGLAVLAIGGSVTCAALGALWPAAILGGTAPIMIGREVIMGWLRGGKSREDPPRQEPEG